MECRANKPYQVSQEAQAAFTGPSILQAATAAAEQTSTAAPAPSESTSTVSRRKILADSSSDDTVSSWMVVYDADASAAYIKQFCASNITDFGLSCDNVFTTTILGFSCQVWTLFKEYEQLSAWNQMAEHKHQSCRRLPTFQRHHSARQLLCKV